MFEGNSLSARYHLRDLEQQFKSNHAGEYSAKPQRKSAPRFDPIPSGSGLTALGLVAITFGSLCWV